MTHHGKVKGPADPVIPAAFAPMGGKPAEALIALQKEFLDSCDEANRAWLARTRLEAVLGFELISRLAAARSIPDVTAAYGHCVTRQLEMLAEDARRILDDSRKFLKSGARFVSSGSSGLRT